MTAFKIAAKLLQIEIWLLLTAYKNSSSLYRTVPSPNPYDIPFSHNTCVTGRRQTTYKQTTHRAHVGHKTVVCRLLWNCEFRRMCDDNDDDSDASVRRNKPSPSSL